ncbi:MAG: hypothetical protein AB1742_09135 [bacterium]
MKIKERIMREIEMMPEDRLGIVLKFIISLEKGSKKTQTVEETPWGTLSLESGAFDFWLDPNEAEYTLDDLKERKRK